MNLIKTEEVTAPVTEVGIVVPPCDRFMLLGHYVSADIPLDSALTAYCSPDGLGYDTGHNYMSGSAPARFAGDPNPSEWNMQPWAKLPQTLDMGCRLGIDVGERPDLGQHFVAWFKNMGTVSGVAVSPVYVAFGHAGAIGGVAGVSDRPAHHGGGKWFAGNGIYGQPQHGQLFDWPVDFYYSGHWRAPGQKIKALLLTMSGAGTLGRKIKTGRFELWV